MEPTDIDHMCSLFLEKDKQISKLKQLVQDMYDSWCICHAHPGAYQTIEATELHYFKERIDKLKTGEFE